VAQDLLEIGALEPRVALGLAVLALVDDDVDAPALQRGMQLRAGRPSDAVDGPRAALLLERAVVRRMPVAWRSPDQTRWPQAH
jgi:hypothetical protein